MSKVDPPFRAEYRTGKPMTPDEQWAELRHCVEVADSIWT